MLAKSYHLRLGMWRGAVPGCGYCTSRKSLSEALSEAFRMAIYYMSDRCNYDRVDVEIEETCDRCLGTGVIRRRPSAARQVKCPACRGKDSSRIVVEKSQWYAYFAQTELTKIVMVDSPIKSAV